VKATIQKYLRAAWPLIIDLWIAGVLAGFVVIRVVGSNTGKHLLKYFRVR
jgi:hypothetical protein